MKHIQTITVGSGGAANIEFTSIPQTYTDLYLVTSIRTNAGVLNNQLYVNVNGSSANGTSRILLGDGTTAGSQTSSRITIRDFPGANATSNTFANMAIYIPSYTGSTNKAFSGDGVMENNATTVVMSFVSALWSQTSAITQLTLLPEFGSFVQYSSASLYGIKNS